MRPFHKLFIAGALALGTLLPGGAQAQYWDKPGYVYAPPPPVYYAPPRPLFVPPPVVFVPPPPRFHAPPVYYGPPRGYYGPPWRGRPHRHHW